MSAVLLQIEILWPLVKPQLDALLKAEGPQATGSRLAALIQAKYPSSADRAALAQALGTAAGVLGA